MMSDCTADTIYAKPLEWGHIRVLALQPGEGNDPLECQIHIVDVVGGEISYEAISYVWGHPDKPEVISCIVDDNHTRVDLPITQNAAGALQAVRKARRERLLWIDLICISQTSSAEKTAQVALMDNIFANATTVLVWLGADDGERSAAAARATTLIHKQLKREMQAYRPFGVKKRADSEARQRCYDQVGTALPLFECEWFWRLWCVQELALARQSLIYWGSTVLKWKAILTTAAFIQSQAQLQVAHMGVAGVYNVVMLEALRKQISSAQEFGQEKEPRDMPFSRLLSLTRLHGVTEPCDRVFSLLGLDSRLSISDSELYEQERMHSRWLRSDRAERPSWQVRQPLVIPDYSQSIDSIYLSTAKALLTRERNLHLLSFVQHDADVGHGDLPSWVPRWHVNKHRLISQLDLIPGHPVYTFLENALAKSTFDESLESRATSADPRSPTPRERNAVDSDGTLNVEGLLLSSVTKVCSDVTFTAERSHQWLATLRHWFRYVSTWFAHHDKSERSELPLSELDDVIFHMFHRTLLGGHFRAEELFMGLRNELTAFRTLLFSEGTDATNCCPITEAFVSQICRSRTLFLTDGGQLGIGPQCLRSGDSICFLEGAAILLLLRARPDTEMAYRRWLLVGETYVDGLTPVTDSYAAGENFETLHSTKARFSNEALHTNEDDKATRSLLHIPRTVKQKSFLRALEERDVATWERSHRYRGDVYSRLDDWCEQLYRFSGPDVAGHLSMATKIDRATRTRFCIG
jgi:hypothetical protein